METTLQTTMTVQATQSHIPDMSGQMVRLRWLELFEQSYATRRVTRGEIEPGVYAVVVPAGCRGESKLTPACVPDMAQGFRLQLENLPCFTVNSPLDYNGWLDQWGRDIAAGGTRVTVYVDLAFLEAALLARLWDHGVLVEFGSPMAIFRRGALTDRADVNDAVAEMISEGRSLADTADYLAPEILARLQTYAKVFLHLSSLYSQATWHIDGENFLATAPGSRATMSLPYWEIKGDYASTQKVLQMWRSLIEDFLQEVMILSVTDTASMCAA